MHPVVDLRDRGRELVVARPARTMREEEYRRDDDRRGESRTAGDEKSGHFGSAIRGRKLTLMAK